MPCCDISTVTNTEQATHRPAFRYRIESVVPIAMPALVTLLVVAPLVSKGWLFLLDWVRGPHVQMPRAYWGLDGGLLAAVPFTLVALGLGVLTNPATMTWLPIALGVFAAGVSMGRLVGGPLPRQVPAGVLYAVNPLVFERIYAGQVAFLLAYGLLPLAVASLLRAQDADSWARRLRPALWITALVGFAAHFAWILAATCLVLLLVRPSRKTISWLILLAVVTLAANSYLVVSSVGRPPPVEVGAGDLASFRTAGDGRLGVFGNVATLHGFWRVEAPRPKDEVPGFPLFMASILVVAAAGGRAAWRKPEARRVAALATGVGISGFVLALGDQGPLGPVYRRLFEDLPGFSIMREPQKFAALLALGYAVLFGFGAERLVDRTGGHRARRAWAAAVVVLPMLATPTLFWGLSGHLRPMHYPGSWQEADRVMGDGSGKVLFLPWHQYLSFPFTNRAVVNPAPVAFRRDTISGDNVELAQVMSGSTSTRSAYLEYLFWHGTEFRSFGQLVAPLGVEYVVLAKTVDWRRYSWLAEQADLEQVLDRADLVVYRNTREVPDGRLAAKAWTVADWGEVVGLSETMDLSGTALQVRRRIGGAVREPSQRPPATPGGVDVGVRRRSETSYSVGSGPAGVVELAEPFDPSWRFGEEAAFELASGTVGLRSDGMAGTARFGHWRRVRLGYAVSALTCLILLVAGKSRSSRRY